MICLKEILRRILTNRSYFLNFGIKWTGMIFTIWGMVALLVPCDNLIDRKLAWWVRLALAALIIICIFACICIWGIIIALNVKRVTLLDVGNNHHVYVQYGDVLSDDIFTGSIMPEKRNILVSVNRCFDTVIDDDLIAKQSLHGQAMSGLYADGEYTEDTLNDEIQKKIKKQRYESISKSDKPRGNLRRYEVGTVAEVESSSGITFFFLGLTSFDKQLHPYISDVEFGVALVKALQYCIQRNQGYPVILPLIGGGRAQTHKEEKDILEFWVKLIQMNRLSINSDIHIVVRESAKDSISILKLKAV